MCSPANDYVDIALKRIERPRVSGRFVGTRPKINECVMGISAKLDDVIV
jgi:hypothetical protein